MPMFFMISGFLYKQRSLKETIKRGGESLIIPYILVNCILLIYTLIIAFVRGLYNSDLLTNCVVAIISGLGYKYGNYSPVCSAMWFFYTLFIVQVLVSLFGKFKRIGWTILSIVSICVVIWQHYSQWDTLLPIDSVLTATPFFLAGYALRGMIPYFSSCRKLELLSILIIIICISLSLINGRVDVDLCLTGNSVFLFYFIAIGISGSLILLAIFFNIEWRVAKVLSIGAPVVVGFNLLAIHIIRTFFRMLGFEWNDLIGIIMGITLIVLFIPLILISKKYFPLILGNRK